MDDEPYPPFWNMVRRCMKPNGEIRHFPRGTYKEQHSNWRGIAEIEAMEITWVVAHACYRKKRRWNGPGDKKSTDSDLKLFKALGRLQ